MDWTGVRALERGPVLPAITITHQKIDVVETTDQGQALKVAFVQRRSSVRQGHISQMGTRRMANKVELGGVETIVRQIGLRPANGFDNVDQIIRIFLFLTVLRNDQIDSITCQSHPQLGV